MKRQIIAFISLFSLVLVLSVYYVMLPFSTSGLDQVVDTQIESSSALNYSSLESNKNESYEEFISLQNEIIASVEASNEEKATALEQIASKNKQIELESKIKEELKEIGYEKVFVEIHKETVTIITSKIDSTKTDVVKIINVAYKILGTNFHVEVMFKN